MQNKFGKKAKIIVAIGMVAVVGIGSGVFYKVQAANSSTDSKTVYKETTVAQGNIIAGVTESGSVSIGTVTQDFDLDSSSNSSTSSSSSSSSGTTSTGTQTTSSSTSSSSSTTSSSTTSSSSSSAPSLEVESVEAKTGQIAAVGDPLLKLTTDSIAEYKDYLQQKVTDATLAYSDAKLTAAETKLKAQYNYNSNVTTGSVAESEYNNTIAQLQNAVTSAQQALDTSATKISQYQTDIANGTDHSAELAQEQINYSTLTAKLASAQNALATGTVTAQETYQEALLKSKNASGLKTVDEGTSSQDVSDAKDDLQDAKDNLSAFETFVGDGTIYAQYAGTIVSIGYEAGDDLSTSTSIATYDDSSAVTMEVSVSEDDITAVTVGNTVNIELAAYEGTIYQGTVTSIDTSASSGSSTVDYTVTVTFSGDVSKVYADMTGDVTFITKEVDNVIYVSDKAIIQDGTKSYVDVKDSNGKISRVEVTTGFSNGENVEVKTGLTAGETALIESQVTSE